MLLLTPFLFYGMLVCVCFQRQPLSAPIIISHTLALCVCRILIMNVLCVLGVIVGSVCTSHTLHFIYILCQVSVFLVGDHTVLFIEPKSSAVSDRISNRIIYAGSKLRLNNARYLVSETPLPWPERPREGRAGFC